jgi:hypothetical protein
MPNSKATRTSFGLPSTRITKVGRVETLSSGDSGILVFGLEVIGSNVDVEEVVAEVYTRQVADGFPNGRSGWLPRTRRVRIRSIPYNFVEDA